MADTPSNWDFRRRPRCDGLEACAQLRQEHLGLVRGELRKRCRGMADEDLEDLEQEIWLAACVALPRFQGKSAVSTWLVGITKHVFWRWLGRQQGRQLGLLRMRQWQEPALAPEPADVALDRVALSEALEHLSQPELTAIELRYFHDLSDGEIAAQLDLPLGTVKGRLRRGLSHLRIALSC